MGGGFPGRKGRGGCTGWRGWRGEAGESEDAYSWASPDLHLGVVETPCRLFGRWRPKLPARVSYFPCSTRLAILWIKERVRSRGAPTSKEGKSQWQPCDSPKRLAQHRGGSLPRTCLYVTTRLPRGSQGGRNLPRGRRGQSRAPSPPPPIPVLPLPPASRHRRPSPPLPPAAAVPRRRSRCPVPWTRPTARRRGCLRARVQRPGRLPGCSGPGRRPPVGSKLGVRTIL